ncbi:MAG: transporter [Acidobacteriota bacterium]|nr:transporter [Acidobacteriota bacterium]
MIHFRFHLTFFLIAAFAPLLFASQPLETETARLLPAGVVKLEGTLEAQTSKEGRERAFPLVIEYGLTDRTELTVEPVFGTAIRPKAGPSAAGPGDLEITLTHLLLPESSGAPALAVAGELKLPTARNRLIGTGKTDYTLWGIASKRIARIDLHGNIGYTVVGRPPGTRLSNTINYALAEEFHATPTFDVVSEVVGNTSATGDRSETSSTGNTTTPELAGAENSFLLGVRYHARPNLFLSIGLSYDNNHALLVRPGVTYRFGTR